jgi:hypothetical protein
MHDSRSRVARTTACIDDHVDERDWRLPRIADIDGIGESR